MIKRISEDDISGMKISALPTRPTAPSAFGGRGFTANDMKEAFDKLPLYLVKKYNELIDAITGYTDESIAYMIPTGISEDHMLGDLITDVRSGAFARYLSVMDKSLTEHIAALILDVARIKRDMGDNYTATEFVTLDCGRPMGRIEGGGEIA